MQTLAFFNSKGGSGKSTLAVHLGVAASHDRTTVLIDVDPQGTLIAWHDAREVAAPAVMTATAQSLKRDLAKLKAEGCDLAIIDCPPYISADSAALMQFCDFVMVPAQPTMPDLSGCLHAVNIIEAGKVPFAFIVNRAPARAPEVSQAINALKDLGEVCPIIIGDRRSFSRALASGQSVSEFEQSSIATQEAASACKWILQRIKEI